MRGPLRFHCLSGSASPWPWILAFFPSPPSPDMSLCSAVISVGWWLVNYCAIPGADWHQTQTLRDWMLFVTKRRGPCARALFHYILGGQNIMQNYSAIFLSWFVPVRADNEEILISCQASLSFVTEQIVYCGDHNTTMGLFTGFRTGVAGGPTLPTAPAWIRENLLKLFTSWRVITIGPITWSIRYQLPSLPSSPPLYSPWGGHLKAELAISWQLVPTRIGKGSSGLTKISPTNLNA